MKGLSVDEWKTHFSLWAISAAPLWAGIDLTKANQSAIDIFLNTEVIAIDQVPALSLRAWACLGVRGRGRVRGRARVCVCVCVCVCVR
jgi:hypothetical protein